MVFDGLEQNGAQKRGDRDREHPAVEQRNQDHPEQIAGEFRRAARRKSNGSKGEDTHQRSAQKRPDRALDHVARNINDLAPPLAPGQHTVGHHDGVVDQHAQSDDQRAQRNAVHRNIAQIHRAQSRRDGEKQTDPDHQARFEAHEQDQRPDNDQQRDHHIDDEIRHRFVDHFALVVELVELHSDRSLIFKLNQPIRQPLAHIDDIGTRYRRNAQHDAGFAIPIGQKARRFAQAARNSGDVAELHHPPFRRRDQQVGYCRHGIDIATGRDNQPLAIDLDTASANDGVLRGELLENRGRRRAQGSGLLTRDLDIDDLILLASNLNLAHTVHAQHVLAQILGVVAQFRHRIAFAGQNVIDAKNIAKFIKHKALRGARRHFRGRIAHLVAQLVPNALERFFAWRGGVFDIDRDFRAAR